MNGTQRLQSGEVQARKGKTGDSLEEKLIRQGSWHGKRLCELKMGSEVSSFTAD